MVGGSSATVDGQQNNLVLCEINFDSDEFHEPFALGHHRRQPFHCQDRVLTSEVGLPDLGVGQTLAEAKKYVRKTYSSMKNPHKGNLTSPLPLSSM